MDVADEGLIQRLREKYANMSVGAGSVDRVRVRSLRSQCTTAR
jgi:hypothetical protein